jgi:hypothetical protein
MENTKNKKENIGLLRDVDLIEVYENRDDLFFDDEAERKEYLTELFSEIVTRYIENVKYENGLTDVTPIDFILKDK